MVLVVGHVMGFRVTDVVMTIGQNIPIALNPRMEKSETIANARVGHAVSIQYNTHFICSMTFVHYFTSNVSCSIPNFVY